MRLARPLFVLSLAAAFAGCSRHVTEPPPPGSGASPRLVASHPAARSEGNFYTTEIWAEFDRPLDPRTVSERSVFLKLDGQRLECVVTYDPTTRRVVLDPVAELKLMRTYTVEFSAAIESADGVALAPNLYFQFSTNSLRQLVYDFPGHGGLVGPLSRLGWGGVNGPLNDVFHEVYAGTDSVAVAQRQVPYLQRTVFTRLLPSVAWPRGQRVYWAVSSHNVTTNERLDGPVSAFEVVDAGRPVVTRVLGARDYGSMNAQSRLIYCQRADLAAGPTFNAAIHWDLFAVDFLEERLVPDDALVVGATVEITALHTGSNRGRFSSGPSLWLAQNDWQACAIVAPGPPYPEVNGLLGEGVFVDSFLVRFDSQRLAAFMEAELQGDVQLHGTLIRTLENIVYESPGSLEPTWRPRLTLEYVLPGPAPPNAAAARAGRRQALEKPAQRRSARLDPARAPPL
jgi:hypothetical protein